MLIKLAWRNLWRNKLRSGVMLAGIVFGMLGVVVMMGISNAMTKNMVDNAIAYQTAHIQIHSKAFLVNPELSAFMPNTIALLAELADKQNIQGVSLRQLADGMVSSAASARGVRINGVDWQNEAKVTRLADSLIAGDGFKGRNPVIISTRSAEELNVRLGSKLVLTLSDIEGQVNGAAFRVTGLYRTPTSGFDEANVFVRKPDLANLTLVKNSHEIAIRLLNQQDITEVKSWLKSRLSDGIVVRDWREIQPLLAVMLGSINTSNMILLGIFMLAMGFGVVNIMLMSVFERTREFGMLMAIGMTKGKVFTLVLLEALALGMTGGMLGILLSLVVITVSGQLGLSLGVMAEGLGAFGVDTILYPQVSVWLYLFTFLLVVLMSLLASLYPARQILKKRPVDALAEKH